MTPTTTVQVGGIRRTLTLEAIIDTGFDGEVCVPLDAGVTLGLVLVGVETVELADGSRTRDLVFAGKAKLLRRMKTVRMSLTTSEDALIGTGLLAGCRLSVDFDSGDVRLKRKPSGSGKQQTNEFKVVATIKFLCFEEITENGQATVIR